MFNVVMGLVVFVATSPSGSDEPGPKTSQEQYVTLLNEHDAAWNAFLKANDEAKTDADLAALNAMPGRNPRLYADRFMALARSNPGSVVAEDSLVWVASHVIFGRETEEAKRLLVRDHVQSSKLARVFAFQILSVGSEATELLYRESISKNPHRDVQAMAHYWLARFLVDKAETSRQWKRGSPTSVSLAPVVVEGWGADVVDRLKRLDPQVLDAEAEGEFERVVREYSEIPHNDKLRPPGTLGTVAASYLHGLRDLTVGKAAPETEGDDLDGQRFRLSDYRGKVVVLNFGSHFNCGTCREMYPHERALVKKLEGQPFALVTIDADVALDDLRAAWKAEGNLWRCVWDRSWDGPINTAWNIQVNPTIYILDHQGVIRYKAAGDPGPELDRVVIELLAERKKPGGEDEK